MSAIIFSHPNAKVKLDDPREPPHPAQPSPLGSITDDGVCVGCGVDTKYHWTISGAWIGCKGALAQRTPPRNPQRWNDPYPAVTCEVRKAILVDCGPALEIHCAGYTHDELLTIAHTLAKAAIAAYQRELAK